MSEAAAVEPEVAVLTSDKLAKANSTVNTYVLAATAAALIPAPGLDVAAITAVQIKMLHSLSKVYGIPFYENVGKSIIASLIGSMGAEYLAIATFGSLVKAVPIAGNLASVVALPVLAGATTYAIGKVFVQHFEAGGNFLNFDPAKARAHFAKLYEEGKGAAAKAEAAAKAHAESASSTAPAK